MRNIQSYDAFLAESGLSSGMFRRRDVVDAAEAFLKGGGEHDTLFDGKPVRLRVKRRVNATDLKKGMVVAASYNRYNQGVDFVEILGVSAAEDKYGKDGAKFDSVKAAMSHYGVKTIKGLEDLEDVHGGHGHNPRLVCRDLEDGSSGAWFYPFEGRFTRGSGGEALSFYELEVTQVKAT